MRHDIPLELTIAEIVPPPADWHPPYCDCPDCHPPHPSDERADLSANQIAMMVLAGFGVGQLICFVLDHFVGGTTILASLGL